ncbi:unnamed protein product [Ixodes persulcatus]
MCIYIYIYIFIIYLYIYICIRVYRYLYAGATYPPTVMYPLSFWCVCVSFSVSCRRVGRHAMMPPFTFSRATPTTRV